MEIKAWNDEELSKSDASSLLIEQYKAYVESAESTSNRRLTTNTFFLSVHTAIIAAVAFSVYQPSNIRGSLLAIGCGIVGIPLCLVWMWLIRSYRRINTVKFKVVGELERRLPASPFWSAEWSLLNHSAHAGESNADYKERKKQYGYTPLALIESFVPICVGLAYTLLIGVAIAILNDPSIVPDDVTKHALEPLDVRVISP